MKINISPTLRIDSDFSVQVLHTFKDGKRAGTSEWRDVSYHSNLADALTAIVRNKRAQGAELTKVERTLAKLNEACNAVQKACDGFITPKAAASIEGKVFSDAFPENFWSH